MNVWADIQTIFSNREIALLLWIFIAAFIVLFTKARKSLVPTIQILTTKQSLVIFSLIGAYLFAIIVLLKNFGLWDFANLKDVLFWFFSVGLILVFKINNATSNAYFKDIFFSAIKWTIVIEFIVSLYTFSLFAEIIFLPVLVLFAAAQAVTDLDKKHKVFSKYLQNIIAMAGFTVFSYSFYKAIANFADVVNFESLVAFLLPVIITILFIPFVYLLALYSTYERYFIDLDFMTIKKDKVKEVKKLILRTANINLNKLIRIKKKLNKGVFYDNTDLKSYIYIISKKSKN